MNLSINNFLKSGLLLLTALIFITCKKENHTIGLDSGNRLDASTLKIDTFTVTTSVFISNNIISSQADSVFLCGAYTDPEFGIVSAETYTQLRLKNEFVELDNAIADSAILYIDYGRSYADTINHYAYGDTTQSQILNIYALDGAISSTDTYYTDSSPISYSTLLTSTTVRAYPNSGYPMAIKINSLAAKAYLQNIIQGPKRNIPFMSQFKGLAIIPGDANGALLRMNRFSVNSYLRIFYTIPGNSNPIPYDLVFDSGTRRFHRITSNRGSSPLSGLPSEYYAEKNTADLNHKCYVQAGTGILTKISFPYLSNFLSSVGNINIHNATLQIIPMGSTTAYPIIKDFILVEDSTNNRFKNVNSNYLSTIQVDGSVQSGYLYPLQTLPDPTTNIYSFVISDYIQALYLKKKVQNSLLLYPGAKNYNGTYANNYNVSSVDRVVFGDNANPSNPMKLIIYYTSVK